MNYRYCNQTFVNHLLGENRSEGKGGIFLKVSASRGRLSTALPSPPATSPPGFALRRISPLWELLSYSQVPTAIFRFKGLHRDSKEVRWGLPQPDDFQGGILSVQENRESVLHLRV